METPDVPRRWADLVAEDLSPRQYVPSDIPVKDPKEEDRFAAPVIWIGKTHKASSDHIKDRILTAFSEAGKEDVEIVELYVTTKSGKDHAYLLLNSKTASDLLLDGSIVVSVIVEEKEIDLWFDTADHLEPNDKQDPYTLFLWQLPKNRPASQIARELKLKIGKWAPICDINVGQDRNSSGKCNGTARIMFDYEFDTQKCVYLLNFNFFLDQEIRAAFCNSDRKPKKPQTKSHGRKTNKRSNSHKLSKSKNSKGHRNNKRY